MGSELWNLSQSVSSKALRTGALLSIETDETAVIEGDLRFQLRTLNNLLRKENNQRLKQAGSHAHNPFKPYDTELYVTDIGTDHICLLNKFNVLDNHLLMVTRDYHPQTEQLGLTDFYAAMIGLSQIDGLVFYNGGEDAGASQPHKHLQLIPTPPSELPLGKQLGHFKAYPSTVETLPFRHAGIAIPAYLQQSPKQAAGWLNILYLKLMDQLGLRREGDTVTTPYNLLLTRKWLMLVPRSQESVAEISFNSLAFVGSLLVKNQAQADALKSMGITKSLRSVT